MHVFCETFTFDDSGLSACYLLSMGALKPATDGRVKTGQWGFLLYSSFALVLASVILGFQSFGSDSFLWVCFLSGVWLLGL